MNARKQDKSKKQDKLRKQGKATKQKNQETKNVSCSISELHALYDFFGDFPIIQPNNIM